MAKAITINDMLELASKNGKCLSTEYQNSKTKLKWQCSKGHIWDAVPGHWCPECTGLLRGTIDKMKRIAKENGGECLSEDYKNSSTKLKWQCSEGHIWEAKPSGIKSGCWCPVCGGTKRHTILEMQQVALLKGGKCLSQSYKDNKTKLKWQCEKGHIWEARPNNIMVSSWCPTCSSNPKYTIKDMQDIAQQKGGKCLSDNYIDGRTKLTWKCSSGHIWESRPINITRGSWCPLCAIANLGSERRLSIQDMIVLAELKGGKCLSTAYKNSKSKLIWQCEKEHTWEAVPTSIKSGHWCPQCAGLSRGNINEMKRIAKERRGECLSDSTLASTQSNL